MKMPFQAGVVGGLLAGVLSTVAFYKLQSTEPNVPSPTAATTPAPQPQSASPAASRTDGRAVADRDARIAELEDAERRLRIEAAFQAGRLRAHEGEPQAWPDDLPEALQPEGFQARLNDALADIEHGELLGVDCDEYPCVAFIQSHNPGDPDAWIGELSPVAEGVIDGVDGAQVSVHNYGENPKIQAIAVYTGQDEDVDHRRDFRMEATVEDLREELYQGPESED